MGGGDPVGKSGLPRSGPAFRASGRAPGHEDITNDDDVTGDAELPLDDPGAGTDAGVVAHDPTRAAAESPPRYASGELPRRADDNVEPEVGELIQGYELLELLGQGGAGSVFRASHPEHGQVALKILAISKLGRPRVVRRFRDEAEIASSVRHPALVEFVELVEQASPRRLAYAMELVRGISLREKLQHANVLALVEAIHIAKQMCLGVGALHDAGIVHRDLKPENVMLIAPDRSAAQTRVKILDFGVAKHVHQTEDGAQAMQEVPGTFVGTPRYMAPEQAAGGEVDGRADLFAIGVMLFEMITGQRPHEGDTLKAVVMAKLKGAPRLTMNPDRELLPQELADTVDACLKLQPDLRPKDARAVMSRLDEAQMVLAAVGAVRLDGATKVVRAVTGASSLPVRNPNLIPGSPTGSGRPAPIVPSAITASGRPLPVVPGVGVAPGRAPSIAPSAAAGRAPSIAPASATPPMGMRAPSLPPAPGSVPPRAGPSSLTPPGTPAVGPDPVVIVEETERGRLLVVVVAGLALVMAVLGSAWLMLGEGAGQVLLSTPQERLAEQGGPLPTSTGTAPRPGLPAAAVVMPAAAVTASSAPAADAGLVDTGVVDAGLAEAGVGGAPAVAGAERARAGLTNVSDAGGALRGSGLDGGRVRAPGALDGGAPGFVVAIDAGARGAGDAGGVVDAGVRGGDAEVRGRGLDAAIARAADAAVRAADGGAAAAPPGARAPDAAAEDEDLEVEIDAPAPPSAPKAKAPAPPPPPADEIP